MAKHYDLGIQGEKVALAELEKNGYEILETNWRYDKAEIDIIATKDNFLVIAEVKTRSSINYGSPSEAVNITKENNLIKATEAYINEKDLDMECRFDIISVIIDGEKITLEHLEGAFTPTF
ncbi:MAG: YraN family protein [Flavobacteriales bacterium]|nr:YraN family protein [Flavobacteriales bacterium]